METPSRRIVLMCSSNKKLAEAAPTLRLYRSALFQQGWEYACSFEAEHYFILSARYGLLPAEKEIVPYPETMSSLSASQIAEWSDLIVADLGKQFNLPDYEVIVLGMRKFVEPLAKQLPWSQTPLTGMSMPELMGFLRRRAWEQE